MKHVGNKLLYGKRGWSSLLIDGSCGEGTGHRGEQWLGGDAEGSDQR